MKVIYTDSPGNDKGVCYRLPHPFFGVISGASEVIVDGDYPHIVNAYQKAGKDVHQAQGSQSESEEDEARESLAAEYEERTGKKAGRMKAETLQEKLDELDQE